MYISSKIRYTFCTRLCEQGMNIKVVQYVMGHEDIATTRNVCNEVTGILQKETNATKETHEICQKE